MSRDPKTGFAQCHAGCRVTPGGEVDIVVEGQQGIRLVERTSGGDAEGDFTIHLFSNFKIAVGLSTLTINGYSAATPLTGTAQQVDSATYRVRVTNGTAATDPASFDFTIQQAAPVTQTL